MPPFQIPCKTFELMKNFAKPWYIADGWAIDLFIGQQTRDHKDIEIAIYRQDQLTLQRYLSDWELVKIAAGQKLAWPPGEHLELPIHELHARSSSGEKLEILLNEHKNQKWQFRRHLSITRPLGQIGMKTNCRAVATRARQLGETIPVIPCGERWQDHSLRPAIEDLIGAGAIINFLQGDKSPEAQLAQTAFDKASSNLAQAIFPCASGKELIQHGFQTDVEIAVQFDVSQSAPLLKNGAYIDQHPAD